MAVKPIEILPETKEIPILICSPPSLIITKDSLNEVLKRVEQVSITRNPQEIVELQKITTNEEWWKEATTKHILNFLHARSLIVDLNSPGSVLLALDYTIVRHYDPFSSITESKPWETDYGFLFAGVFHYSPCFASMRDAIKTPVVLPYLWSLRFGAIARLSFETDYNSIHSWWKPLSRRVAGALKDLLKEDKYYFCVTLDLTAQGGGESNHVLVLEHGPNATGLYLKKQCAEIALRELKAANGPYAIPHDDVVIRPDRARQIGFSDDMQAKDIVEACGAKFRATIKTVMLNIVFSDSAKDITYTRRLCDFPVVARTDQDIANLLLWVIFYEEINKSSEKPPLETKKETSKWVVQCPAFTTSSPTRILPHDVRMYIFDRCNQDERGKFLPSIVHNRLANLVITR